ncbi:hypothetical protein UCMB321_0927 [Pseudomonas batumici]|uniref:Uncharacterized protein n=1 Tax=Pseudomonas batumici TaxID=226910 RepID=A0A0C2F2M4_9PSED|nr:hypothetical protein UCMB321_0927 [Pseudomonas batumici]
MLKRQARQCDCVIHTDYSLQTDPTGWVQAPCPAPNTGAGEVDA